MEDTDNSLLEIPPLTLNLPLEGDVWVGGDGAKWCDVAVESSSAFVQVWVRRRLKDNTYFVIASVVRGHVLAYEITKDEAKELYAILPSRAPYSKAFGSGNEKKEDKEA